MNTEQSENLHLLENSCYFQAKSLSVPRKTKTDLSVLKQA